MIEAIGQKTIDSIENLGRFSRFVTQAYGAILHSLFKPRSYPLVLTQMYSIGVQSVPVVMATGAFVGMILAIQTYGQLASMGLEERLDERSLRGVRWRFDERPMIDERAVVVADPQTAANQLPPGVGLVDDRGVAHIQFRHLGHLTVVLERFCSGDCVRGARCHPG